MKRIKKIVVWLLLQIIALYEVLFKDNKSNHEIG